MNKKYWGTTTGMLTQLLPDKQLEVPLEQEKKKCEQLTALGAWL